MSASRTRAARLLTLLPWLHRHSGVTVAKAAEAFNVTERQLQADLQTLTFTGPSQFGGGLVDIQYDSGTIEVIDTQSLDSPLRLSPDEAAVLAIALRWLADLPGVGEAGALQSVSAKLAGLTSEAGAVPPLVVAPPAGEVERAHTDLLDEAIAARRCVEITYTSQSTGRTSVRVIEPGTLLTVRGFTYVEAWCRTAEAVRLFRTDRISSATLRDETAVARPLTMAEQMASGELGYPHEVVLAIEPRHAEALTELGARLSRTRDGRLRARLRVGDLRWAARLVLRLGPGCEVVEPGSLREDVHQRATAALLSYRSEPPRVRDQGSSGEG